MALRITLLTFLLLVMAVSPAATQEDVYDNGPSDGQDYGWVINFGFATSDSFVYNNPDSCGWGAAQCPINGVTFVAWLFPGDTLQSAEVSITSSEFGGISYFDQTVSFTESGCYGNNMDFNVCTESGAFPGVYLDSGTYWLNLQNAQTTIGDPVYWDQNSGPSLASSSSLGTIPSESFTILGATTSSCLGCYTTPEPIGLEWLTVGLLGLLLTGSRKYL